MTAMHAPAVAANSARGMPAATRSDRVSPSDRRVGCCARPCAISRNTTTPIAKSPAPAATTAKIHSTAVSTSIARWAPLFSELGLSTRKDSLDPNICRATSVTCATPAAPPCTRRRRSSVKSAIFPLYARSNAGVRVMMPPDAARSLRSAGRRTIPDDAKARLRSLRCEVARATCSGVNETVSSTLPTLMPVCWASDSLIVASSTASGSARRPAMTRGRSTAVPKLSSTLVATATLGRSLGLIPYA